MIQLGSFEPLSDRSEQVFDVDFWSLSPSSPFKWSESTGPFGAGVHRLVETSSRPSVDFGILTFSLKGSVCMCACVCMGVRVLRVPRTPRPCDPLASDVSLAAERFPRHTSPRPSIRTLPGLGSNLSIPNGPF